MSPVESVHSNRIAEDKLIATGGAPHRTELVEGPSKITMLTDLIHMGPVQTLLIAYIAMAAVWAIVLFGMHTVAWVVSDDDSRMTKVSAALLFASPAWPVAIICCAVYGTVTLIHLIISSWPTYRHHADHVIGTTGARRPAHARRVASARRRLATEAPVGTRQPRTDVGASRRRRRQAIRVTRLDC